MNLQVRQNGEIGKRIRVDALDSVISHVQIVQLMQFRECFIAYTSQLILTQIESFQIAQTDKQVRCKSRKLVSL